MQRNEILDSLTACWEKEEVWANSENPQRSTEDAAIQRHSQSAEGKGRSL